jgi:hypothetical protein
VREEVERGLAHTHVRVDVGELLARILRKAFPRAELAALDGLEGHLERLPLVEVDAHAEPSGR